MIQDDEGNFEVNERTSALEAEQLAETYLSGFTTSVCSVCKQGLVRRYDQYLRCETRNCIDLCIPYTTSNEGMGFAVPEFSVELLMQHFL